MAVDTRVARWEKPAPMFELPHPQTIIEPFKIKMIEPIPMPTLKERRHELVKAHYNLFNLSASTVTFDLLTDSGTAAMSAEQWAAVMRADESYAGSVSYQRFEAAVQEVTGLPYVVPTHQGRSAEFLLMRALLKPGQWVLGNTHFDTTRANIEVAGAVAVDLPDPATRDTASLAPFKGNIDLAALEATLQKEKAKVALVILTVTNNSVGGQPVSLANARAASELARKHGVPFFLDCARFAEDCWFIKQREAGQGDRSVALIARDLFQVADGALMSMKKDAFGNIGGFLAMRNRGLAEQVRSLMVVTEGFPTYGGLAGRDLEALAVGLKEVLDERYLEYRVRSIEYFGRGLEAAGFPTVRPWGGHAVYVDAARALPQLSALEYPGQALSVALYEYIGIRGVEVGTVMLGTRDPQTGAETPAPKELVRLAMPRRVYTQSHVDYMLELAGHLSPHLGGLKGYEITWQPEVLRHFTCRFKPR